MNKGLIILLLFCTCCKPKTKVQDDIMPVNKMKEVMWDMIQAETLASSYIAKDSSKNLKEETLKLYSKVYTLHQISMEDFRTSYSYYKKNPAMEKILIDSLLLYGNKMRENNYKKSSFVVPIKTTSIYN